MTGPKPGRRAAAAIRARSESEALSEVEEAQLRFSDLVDRLETAFNQRFEDGGVGLDSDGAPDAFRSGKDPRAFIEEVIGGDVRPALDAFEKFVENFEQGNVPTTHSPATPPTARRKGGILARLADALEANQHAYDDPNT